MPANGRWDLIRRLKVKDVDTETGPNIPTAALGTGRHFSNHYQQQGISYSRLVPFSLMFVSPFFSCNIFINYLSVQQFKVK